MDIINQLLLHQGVSYLHGTREKRGIMKSPLPGRKQSNIIKIGILIPSSIIELQEMDLFTPTSQKYQVSYLLETLFLPE